jgi:hypothetical protein
MMPFDRDENSMCFRMNDESSDGTDSSMCAGSGFDTSMHRDLQRGPETPGKQQQGMMSPPAGSKHRRRSFVNHTIASAQKIRDVQRR